MIFPACPVSYPMRSIEHARNLLLTALVALAGVCWLVTGDWGWPAILLLASVFIQLKSNAADAEDRIFTTLAFWVLFGAILSGLGMNALSDGGLSPDVAVLVGIDLLGTLVLIVWGVSLVFRDFRNGVFPVARLLLLAGFVGGWIALFRLWRG